MEGAKPHQLIKRAGGRCPSAQDQDRTLLGDTGGWGAGFSHSGSMASQYRPPSSLPALGAPRSFPKVAGAKAPPWPRAHVAGDEQCGRGGCEAGAGRQLQLPLPSPPVLLSPPGHTVTLWHTHAGTVTAQCSRVHAVHLGCRITDTLMPTQDAQNTGHHCAHTQGRTRNSVHVRTDLHTRAHRDMNYWDIRSLRAHAGPVLPQRPQQPGQLHPHRL